MLTLIQIKLELLEMDGDQWLSSSKKDRKHHKIKDKCDPGPQNQS